MQWHFHRMFSRLLVTVLVKNSFSKRDGCGIRIWILFPDMMNALCFFLCAKDNIFFLILQDFHEYQISCVNTQTQTHLFVSSLFNEAHCVQQCDGLALILKNTEHKAMITNSDKSFHHQNYKCNFKILFLSSFSLTVMFWQLICKNYRVDRKLWFTWWQALVKRWLTSSQISLGIFNGLSSVLPLSNRKFILDFSWEAD